VRVLFVQNNGIQESIGIANLSGILKANGHETDLLLVSHTPDLIGAIERYDPGLIAFSALTGVHHSLEKLAVRIKQRLTVPIIVGGPHPTYSPEMIDRPGIDIICRGEGELAMLELADAMQHDRDVTRIRNLHVKARSGVVHKNDLRPPVPLDDLPMPDRELYYKYRFLRDMPMKRFVSSMGCPYPCTFCHEPVIRAMYKSETMPDNILFRIIGSFNMCQELLFYRVKPIPALRYFHNTVLMTGRSDLSMTMRTIPSLLRRKKRTAEVLEQKEIYEAGRGYF
jgi:radical SAM superfamily enzyme YgiQ (UPF0313 family)